MAADAETFSVETIRVNGEPFVALNGLKVTDPVSVLGDKFCDASGMPQSHVTARLKLIQGTTEVSLTSSGSLGDAGYGPGTVLTAILQAEPQVYEYSMDYQKDCALASEQSRLLLLADSCFLVRKEFDPCDATGGSERPMKWDVLRGTYEIADGKATCSWNVHLQRTIVYDEEDPENTTDSGWQKMDERASFRWKRLVVTEKVDIDWLDKKLASMSLEELQAALLEDARSNDKEDIAEGLDEMFQDFPDDNTQGLLRSYAACNELGEDADVEKKFLCSQLKKLYRGNNRMDEIWSQGLPSKDALIPGEVLGPSPCWIRLEESEEKKVCADSDVQTPGMEFGKSCLLGIQVNDFFEEKLDLTDLPELLGLSA